MTREIHYKDALDLGFKREDRTDSVFFNQFGFGYFLMNRKLYKGITAEWDMNTRAVRVIRCNDQGDILGQIDVQSLEELKSLIAFFCNEKRRVKP